MGIEGVETDELVLGDGLRRESFGGDGFDQGGRWRSGVMLAWCYEILDRRRRRRRGKYIGLLLGSLLSSVLSFGLEVKKCRVRCESYT